MRLIGCMSVFVAPSAINETSAVKRNYRLSAETACTCCGDIYALCTIPVYINTHPCITARLSPTHGERAADACASCTREHKTRPQPGGSTRIIWDNRDGKIRTSESYTRKTWNSLGIGSKTEVAKCNRTNCQDYRNSRSLHKLREWCKQSAIF